MKDRKEWEPTKSVQILAVKNASKHERDLDENGEAQPEIAGETTSALAQNLRTAT